MSERIYWRDGHRVDFTYGDDGPATKVRAEHPDVWERVHVLTDTEKAKWQAEAWFEGKDAVWKFLPQWVRSTQPVPVNPYLPKARDHSHHWVPRPVGKNSLGEYMFVLKCERCEETYDPPRASEPETVGAEVTDD